MFTSVLSKIQQWLLGASIVIMAMAYAFFRGRDKGTQDAVNQAMAEAAKTAADANKEVQDARKEVASMADGTAADRLRDDWMRDEK